MSSIDILKAYQALKTNDEEEEAFKHLHKHITAVNSDNKKTKETHRIAVLDNENIRKIHLYLTPLIDRMHSLEPHTPVSYKFRYTESNELLIDLDIGGREFMGEEEQVRTLALLRRTRPILRLFINANKGSDGCTMCGAHPKESCNTDCEVLEAELLLGGIRKALS